jgi:hypothetical protein
MTAAEAAAAKVSQFTEAVPIDIAVVGIAVKLTRT